MPPFRAATASNPDLPPLPPRLEGSPLCPAPPHTHLRGLPGCWYCRGSDPAPPFPPSPEGPAWLLVLQGESRQV